MLIYTFDKVVNDTYAEYGGIKKFYNSVLRSKIASDLNKKVKKGLTVLMFGPQQSVQKIRKESPLLSGLVDYNMALRCCTDLLNN